MRHRVRDRRVLGLVKAFLKPGILTEGGAVRDTITGTPQGGITPGYALAAGKYPKRTWRSLIGRYLPRWRPTDGEVTLFNPANVATTRYRYRGAKIATPWQAGWIARRDLVCGPERLENLIAL
jgi:retron-type reverse transcriptase